MSGLGAPCLAYMALHRLPAVRWATKVELYRMLVAGRRHLDHHFRAGATVREAAGAACMSPYHFVRLFRSLFNETPGEYLTRLRLAEARRLLLTTNLPIGEIAFMVGLQQTSSLSRLCRQQLGDAPSALRRNFATSGKCSQPAVQ